MRQLLRYAGPMLLWHPDSPGIKIWVTPNWWHRIVGSRTKTGELRFASLGEAVHALGYGEVFGRHKDDQSSGGKAP